MRGSEHAARRLLFVVVKSCFLLHPRHDDEKAARTRIHCHPQMSEHGEETDTHADEAAVEAVDEVQAEQPAVEEENTATEAEVKEPTPAQSLGPSESM